MTKEEEKVIELIGQGLQKAAARIEEQQAKLKEVIDGVRDELFKIAQTLIESNRQKFDTEKLESLEYKPESEEIVKQD